MSRLNKERGFTILEVIIALGILGLIGTAFVSAVGNSSRSTRQLDDHVLADSIARTEMEKIKAIPTPTWLASYPTPTPGGMPPDYSVSISTAYINDPNCANEYLTPGPNSCNTLQQITVKVSRGGQPILSITDYKKK